MKDSSSSNSDQGEAQVREKVEVREIHHYHDRGDQWEKRISKALNLITLGLVLLLNTTGVLSWSVWWELIKFWPAFIICAGIGLIMSFSRVTRFIADIVCYFIFLTILLFAAVNTGSSTFSGLGINSPQMSIWPFMQSTNSSNYTSHEDVLVGELPNAKILNLFIDDKFGSFTMNGMVSDNVLFSKDIHSESSAFFSSGYNGTIEKDQTLYYHIDTNEQRGRFFWSNAPSMDLKVSNSYERMYLNAKFGAGDSVLNFNNSLKLDSVNVDTGAGQLTINIEKDSLPNLMILKVGTGKMSVTLPADVGYYLDYNVGVGAVILDDNKISGGLGTNSTKQSNNWSNSAQKVMIKVNVGVGEFNLNTK